MTRLFSRFGAPGFPVAAFRSWEDAFTVGGGGRESAQQEPSAFVSVLILPEDKKDDMLGISIPCTTWF